MYSKNAERITRDGCISMFTNSLRIAEMHGCIGKMQVAPHNFRYTLSRFVVPLSIFCSRFVWFANVCECIERGNAFANGLRLQLCILHTFVLYTEITRTRPWRDKGNCFDRERLIRLQVLIYSKT